MKLYLILLLFVTLCFAEEPFVFIQLTDTHFSRTEKDSRLSDFHEFINGLLNIIDPKILLFTGDITDGRRDGLLSGDNEEEWQIYYNELKAANWFNRSKLLDIRGNHDHTNTNDSPSLFYHKYTICGQEDYVYLRSFKNTQNENICFIGYDGTYNPALSLSETFFGVSSSYRKRVFESLNYDSCDFRVFFTHFPTAYMDIDYIKDSLHKYHPDVFTCGHLHRIVGGDINGYTSWGGLQIAVEDWKVHRIIGFNSYYHQTYTYEQISYFEYKKHPIVFVQYPAKATMYYPNSNLTSIFTASDIRFSIYSQFNITFIKVSLNSKQIATYNNNSINYSIPFSVEEYKLSSGYHTLSFEITGSFPSSSSQYIYSHIFYIPKYYISTSLSSFSTLSINTSHLYSSFYSSINNTFSLRDSQQSLVHLEEDKKNINTVIYEPPSVYPGSVFGYFLLSCELPTVVTIVSYVAPMIAFLLFIYPYFALKYYYKIDIKQIRKLSTNHYNQRLSIYNSISNIPHISKLAIRYFFCLSDTYIFAYFIISVVWEQFLFYRIGTIDGKWIIQFLWGTINFDSDHNETYTKSIDIHTFHLFFITFTYFIGFIYFLLYTSPSIYKKTFSKLQYFFTILWQLICILAFACFVPFYKLYIIGMNLSFVDLLMSPVWFWSAFFPWILIIREFIYEYYYRTHQTFNMKQPTNQNHE